MKDRPPIQDCLRKGKEIVVQVTKEGMKTKGATLSTYALFEDAPESAERELNTAFGRLRILPTSGVALTLEVQSLVIRSTKRISASWEGSMSP